MIGDEYIGDEYIGIHRNTIGISGSELIMRIAVAFDHAGFGLKHMVLDAISAMGDGDGYIGDGYIGDEYIEVLDLGTNGPEPVDYPDFAEKLGRAIQEGRAERGILVCGSGVGASIAINKMKGVYAGLCHDTYSAHQGVEHDDMNVLCLGARIIGPELAKEIIRAFLGAKFCEEERHIRRVGKIRQLEEREQAS